MMRSLLFTAFLVAIGAFLFRMFLLMDLNKVVHPHRPGVCRVVEGPVHGSEDIELIRSDGIAFITSGILYLSEPHPDVKGKMFLYDFSQKGKTLKALELPIKGDGFDKENFHPHGMTHWVVNGIIRLYIVNHNNEFKHSIEVFDYDKSGRTLTHKKSIKNEKLVRPNDLVAVGPDAFIFTNDGAAQNKWANLAEMLTGYKGGSVGYYDGQNFHTLLTGLNGPNGITYDQKANVLYVSHIMDERIVAYQLSKDKKTATELSSTPVYTGADNLFLDTDGSIYTGAHPITYLCVKHISKCTDLNIYSPSQVLRLKYTKPNESAKITEVYVDPGTQASASASAVRYQNQMLVGTVCRQLVHCEIADVAVLE